MVNAPPRRVPGRFLILIARRPRRSTLFPYTTLFRSFEADGNAVGLECGQDHGEIARVLVQDRKSTRLNSSHLGISYAVFCLKKKRPSTSARVVASRAIGSAESTRDTWSNSRSPSTEP